jgi:hypothetical protein
VSAAGGTVTARVVEASLARYQLKVALACGRVGLTEPLEAMAKRHKAAAAINGCFFDAYSGKAIRNPYHTLIVGGRMVHRGDKGALLGIWPNGYAHIAAMTTRLCGSLDGSEKWPNNWYAYWLNRLPENATTVTIFTPAYGSTRTPSGGTQVTIRSGRVHAVGAGSQTIPADGYVAYFSGSEAKLAQRLRVGRACAWRVSYAPADGSPGWDQVRDGMGCWPHLLGAGQIKVTSATVTRGGSGEGGNRSAVGLKPNGNVLFVTTGSISLLRLAHAMKALGCSDALNLDGGASSGLMANGQFLTRPGRRLPNALVLVRR